MFDLLKDVKLSIAINNENQFPIDPNTANFNELIKVPGIGPETAKKIINERNEKRKQFKEFKELKKIGLLTQKSQPFLSLTGSKQLKFSDFC